MVLPVPWCWANLSYNHLSALPLSLCHLCSNRLPAWPVNPQCIHQGRGRCPGRDSWCQCGRLRQRGGFGADSRDGRSEEEGAVWWSSGGTEVPGSDFSHLPPVAAVPVQVSLPAGSGSSGLVHAPLCFVLSVPLVLEWQGLAPCFTSDSAPLLVLQSHCCGLFEELWMVLAFETNRFWV